MIRTVCYIVDATRFHESVFNTIPSIDRFDYVSYENLIEIAHEARLRTITHDHDYRYFDLSSLTQMSDNKFR